MTTRSDHEFPAGSGRCAAWVYEPPGGEDAKRRPCVIMAHGFSLTRHEGLPPYAECLAGAGATVLLFDYRHLGASPGQPRQRFRKAAQLEDWRAAVVAARAPKAELHRYPYSHFEPFLGDGPKRIAEDQVDFLRRAGLLSS